MKRAVLWFSDTCPGVARHKTAMNFPVQPGVAGVFLKGGKQERFGAGAGCVGGISVIGNKEVLR